MIALNARPSFLTKQVLDTSDILTLAFGLTATLLAIIAIFATLVARNNRSTQGNSRFTHTETLKANESNRRRHRNAANDAEYERTRSDIEGS
jgi:hypothetical protein